MNSENIENKEFDHPCAIIFEFGLRLGGNQNFVKKNLSNKEKVKFKQL